MNNHQQLIQNFTIIVSKYFEIYKRIVNKQSFCLPNDPLQLNNLVLKFFNQVFQSPDNIIKYQMSFFKSQLEAVERIYHLYYKSTPNINELTIDKRFKNNLWHEHCTFAWLKEAYFTYSDWLENIIHEMPKNDFSSLELRRLNFVIKQFLDSIAPNNFPCTNPEVIQSFFDTAGENFIKGLDNLVNDLNNSKHSLNINNNDHSKFKLGYNIAATSGKVVYQNKLIQLIHYKPLKEKHYQTPLLIIPPFINKYYVMDLQKDNSFVKWLLENNHNVFIISWVNPDESLAEINFSDYVIDGAIAALDYITKTLKFEQINSIGYCIGGTLLATTIAYLKKLNDSRIKTASFIATLINFEEAGDLSIFIDDYFIKETKQYMEISGGFLDGEDISTTFNLLRSNDAIWPHYINNYLLGKEPFPFDLLYWNSDSTRLPMALHLFYLEKMYKDNLLKTPNAISIGKVGIDISCIDIPCFSIATKSDHIVPWKNAFSSTKLFSGNKTFVLAESGHVAGVINHPKQNKYCYWINEKRFDESIDNQTWLEGAEKKQGSWWVYWQEWIKPYSGELINSKNPEEINSQIIEDAPGSYVKKRY